MKDIIYQPEFIPYYLKETKDFWLNHLQGLAYGFIRFYWKNNKFYFSSKQFAEIIWTTEKTIDNIISQLSKKWIIITNTKRFNNNWIITSSREIKINNLFSLVDENRSLFSLPNENTISLVDENTISLVDEIKDNNKKNNKENIPSEVDDDETYKKTNAKTEYIKETNILKDCSLANVNINKEQPLKENTYNNVPLANVKDIWSWTDDDFWEAILNENLLKESINEPLANVINTPQDPVEEIYCTYTIDIFPKKKWHKKASSLERIKLILKKYNKEQIIEAIKKYRDEKKQTIAKQEWCYIKTCENFFWNDKWTKIKFIDNYI